MEPGFSRTVYMQMMTKWMLLWGWGVIVMLGRVGWLIAMKYGWRWQLPLSIAFGALLGVPLWRIWRLFKKLLPLWAKEDTEAAARRVERHEQAVKEKEIELLEREKQVRLERLRQQRERDKAIAELAAMQDELEDELRDR
jgi:hypothetical protein